jgi:secreted Zn-dependent insulinase-like peptidase
VASEMAHSSALNAALTDLLVCVMKDMIQEQLYLASMASLDLNISSKDISIDFTVSGFSDKAPDLLIFGLANLFEHTENFSVPVVARQAELLLRAYSNTSLSASAAVDESRLCALKRDNYCSEDKRVAFSEISANSESLTEILERFRGDFVHHICVEVLAQGNINADRYLKVIEDIAKMCRTGDMEVSALHYPEQCISIVPAGKTFILHSIPKNLSEKNIAVEFCFQHGVYNLHELTMLQLLDQILYEPFFDAIRTRAQIGYSVSCGARDNFGVLEFYFSVVSSSHLITDVMKAVSDYIVAIPSFISSMILSSVEIPPSELCGYVFLDQIKSQIDLKLRPDTTLHGSAKLNWTSIKSRRYNFDRFREQVLILVGKVCSNPTDIEHWISNLSMEKLEEFREEVISFVKNLFLNVSTRKLLVVQASSAFSRPDLHRSIRKKKAKRGKTVADHFGLESAQVFSFHEEMHSIHSNSSVYRCQV